MSALVIRSAGYLLFFLTLLTIVGLAETPRSIPQDEVAGNKLGTDVPSAITAVPVGAGRGPEVLHSGIVLSALAPFPPVIDGRLDTVADEWDAGDFADFPVDDGAGGTVAGRVYEMNDADNMYLAVRFDLVGPQPRLSIAAFEFDNDHDDFRWEEGDDGFVLNQYYGFFDNYRTTLPPCPGGICGIQDTLGGGTTDGSAAFGTHGTFSVFEFVHPLDSTDDAHDFSLGPGDVIGFDLIIQVNTTGSAETRLNAGDIIIPGAPPGPPHADAGGPYVGAEGSPIRFDAGGSSDPEGDPIQFRWDFEADGVWDTGWSLEPQAAFTWGDDWVGTALVEVTDGVSTATSVASVAVGNLAPVVDRPIEAFVVADLSLRVAGEKWHDVRMDVMLDGGRAGTAWVGRFPGSPVDQSATLESVKVSLSRDFRIALYYTPEDDHTNGQPNGATPAWVILRFSDGTEARVLHTFSVQHPDTWAWTIDDLRPYLVGHPTSFAATASDVGSDDLILAWDFGDGGTASATYFNDGVGPDSFPSPEVKPITAAVVMSHVYAAAGSYVVRLTVVDDDGGTVIATLALRISG